MSILKTLLWSLLYGLQDMFFVLAIIVVCLGLLYLVLSTPWGIGTVLVLLTLATGYDSYTKRTKS